MMARKATEIAGKKIRSDKQALLGRVRRVIGQVQAVERMLTQDAYCIEVLTQIAAARAALLSLGRVILNDHMRSCVADSFRHGRADEAIEEINRVLALFVK